MPRVHGNKRLDDDACLSLQEKGRCCVLDALGRRPVETHKKSRPGTTCACLAVGFSKKVVATVTRSSIWEQI